MTILGQVSLRSFDEGCFHTLGGRVVRYEIDGSSRANYVVDIPGIRSGLEQYGDAVPLFFDVPEDAYQDFILPSIVFRRSAMTPAFERQPWYTTVARGPSKDAEPVYDPEGRVLGFTRYATQLRGDPYDITYDLVLYSRRQQEMNVSLGWLLRIMRPPWFVFKVVDSLGDVREYDAGELSFSNSGELSDISERMSSYTVSFLVRGEIDTYDDLEAVSMTDRRISVARK